MEKAYTVLNIWERMRTREGRGLYKVYQHQIETKGGIVLTVDIGEEDFTPERAEPILTAKAKNADAIKKS